MAKLKKVNEDLQDKDPILSEDQLRERREEITKFYKTTGRLVIMKLGKKLSAFITKFDKIE